MEYAPARERVRPHDAAPGRDDQAGSRLSTKGMLIERKRAAERPLFSVTNLLE
jgi:hypothetical protein